MISLKLAKRVLQSKLRFQLNNFQALNIT